MKTTFMVINVTPIYGDGTTVRYVCTDRFTGQKIESTNVLSTRELEGYLIHETETEFLIEERRYAKSN